MPRVIKGYVSNELFLKFDSKPVKAIYVSNLILNKTIPTMSN